MKFVILCAIKWYLKTFKSQPVTKIYNDIARLFDVSVVEIRKLEKSMIRTEMRLLDIRYLKRCDELSIIPEFLEFKPPKLEVYHRVDKFYKKVLVEQLQLAREEFCLAKKIKNDNLVAIRSKLSMC